MSRCAHSQSTYQLRRLPKCSRCKQEFVLVYSTYGEGNKAVAEWECQKCHKVVRRGLLREDQPSEDEKFFEAKSKELQRQYEADRKTDRQAAFRRTLQSRSEQQQ